MSESRKKNPTGWLKLTRYPSLALIIDGLLSMPPGLEFNKTELAQTADVSRVSVVNHMDTLLELEVVEEIDETSPQRYRFNEKSPVSGGILDLNGRINAVGMEEHDA